MTGDVPLHVVPDRPGHGVVLLAQQVAGAVGARTCDVATALTFPRLRAHVHVTDRLFGATAREAGETLTALARHHRTTVTLHDVPQVGDGEAFAERAAAYAALLGEASQWVVSSQHESDLVREHLRPRTRGLVVPLPVLPLAPPAGGRGGRRSTGETVVGVLGWLYPGKGHAEVLRACAGLPGRVVVRAVGGVAEGHDHLLDELRALAASCGVTLEVTGWVDDDAWAEAIEAVDVPVAAHRHVSASGSVNSWIAARRRPLVASGAYASEMARLRPGTLTVVEDDDLPAALARAAREPASTWLDDATSTGPGLGDVARAYLDLWAHA